VRRLPRIAALAPFLLFLAATLDARIAGAALRRGR
jgi:hypothetical protein